MYYGVIRWCGYELVVAHLIAKFMWVKNNSYFMGEKIVGKAKMDERGRVLIPLDDREKLGLKAGVEFDVLRKDGTLLLKPIFPEPLRVDGSRRKWGREAFLDSGEATFGE